MKKFICFLPQGFHSKEETRVFRLLKTLCGLKQASRQWYIKLTIVLLDVGYKQSSHDHSLFTKYYGDDIVALLIYVDDIFLTGSNHTVIDDIKKYLHSQFKVKYLGELKYLLEIEVLRSQYEILMNQMKYALKLISSVGLAGTRLVHIPLEANVKLTSREHDKYTGTHEDPLFKNICRYQKLMGKLLT